MLMDYMKSIMNLRRSMIIMNNDENKVNEFPVDVEKANRLIRRIIIAESRNIKSGEKNDTQMIKDIKKMIEEEVNCY